MMDRLKAWRPWRVQAKYAPLRAGIAWVPDTGGDHIWAVKLLFPAFIFHRSGVYDVNSDALQEGWFVLWLMVGVYASHQFFDVRFAYGWVRTGKGAEV